jgi:hypothetical protein
LPISYYGISFSLVLSFKGRFSRWPMSYQMTVSRNQQNCEFITAQAFVW